MAHLSKSIVGNIRTFLEEKQCKTVLNYLDALPAKKQLKWVISVCKTRKWKPAATLDQIRMLRAHFRQRVDLLKKFDNIPDAAGKENAVDKEMDWLSVGLFDEAIQEAVNRLEPLTGNPTDWATFENKIYRKGSELQEETDQAKRVANQERQLDYWQDKLNQMQALEELFPYVKEVCQLVTHLKTTENTGAQPTEEGDTDGRVKYTKEMKQEAENFYNDHKAQADNMPGKTWVEKHCIPHLAKEFEKEESFFKESTIRRNWLKLTS